MELVLLYGVWTLTTTYELRNVTHPSRSRWVDRSSGHIFRGLWIKVHKFKFPRTGQNAVCEPFSLWKYSRSRRKIAEIVIFWALIFEGCKGPQISDGIL